MVQVAQAQAGQPFPKGDELGDVGQYYSVLSPRKGSATYIQNTSASSQTVNVAIYQDTGGSPVETLVCTVPGNRTLQIDMIDDSGTGTLDVEGYSGGANCGDKTGYHGVYHMKIWSGGNLAVTVRHVIGPAGAYWAVADKFADDYHLLPGIYLCDGSGCWDTEFVVQNTTGTTTNVHFSWNPDDEAGFYDNNEAQLDGNERRSFLASQLMLANTGGGALTQKDCFCQPENAADDPKKTRQRFET